MKAVRTLTINPGPGHGLDYAIDRMFEALLDLVQRRQRDLDAAPLSGKLPCSPLVPVDDPVRRIPEVPVAPAKRPYGKQKVPMSPERREKLLANLAIARQRRWARERGDTGAA